MSDHAGEVPEPDIVVEFVWDRLWPQLALRDGFWLGYLFCSDLSTVNVLVARADDYVRRRVKGTQARTVRDPDELQGILDRLLSDHDPHVGLTWVIGIAGDPQPWRPAWSQFLRRLNERRDVLTGRMPGGLVLCLPEGLLPTARDSAPDLWSYRSMVVDTRAAATLGSMTMLQRRLEVEAATMALPTLSSPALLPRLRRPQPSAVVERALLPAVEPSEQLRAVLRPLAAALQAGDTDAAVTEARTALATASASGVTGDLVLAHAWTARTLREKEDLAGAIDHAVRALHGEAPLGMTLTQELLEILASSPDLDTVLAVREAQLALARNILDRDPDSTEALRDLSISLNNVGDINRQRGRLDDALAGYAESLDLRRRILARFGDTPEALRDLSVSLDRVGDTNRQRGQLDDALAGYAESLDLRRRILARFGDTPEALRDLSVSLNRVGDINWRRGQLDDALAGYAESLGLARRILARFGDTPEALRDLSVSLNNVGDINWQRGQLDDALASYTESLEVYRRLMGKYGPPIADPDELASISENIDLITAELARLAEPSGGQD